MTKKTVALDYDHTFTTDPETWIEITNLLRAAGFRIIGVTMRNPTEVRLMEPSYFEACDDVIFTGRKAKEDYVRTYTGYQVDIWIDDQPLGILQDFS